MCIVADLMALHDVPIKRLSLSGCDSDSETTLASLRSMPITELYIEEAIWETDDGIENLMALPLTKLTLCHCDGLTDARAERLQNLPSLVNLVVEYCSGLSETGIALLKEATNVSYS